MTFEDAMTRLEEIVAQLENGGQTLNESLRLFEEGIKLARECSRQLTEAKGKLEQLIKSDDGSLEVQDFDL
ncbi:MAG: exodeoxyribonuclease VII small subunit [Armatimonadetes bacterium]|nr:exodeoxyribonuclease VII small subunit [Armatimonadota bacterium]